MNHREIKLLLDYIDSTYTKKNKVNIRLARQKIERQLIQLGKPTIYGKSS